MSAESGRVRVLVHPHIDEANRYLGLLYGALETETVQATPFSWRNLLSRSYDVLHVHWPELAVGPKSTVGALVRTIELLGVMAVAKLRGTAIVWTAHNLGSHECWHPFLERVLFTIWVRKIDAWLTLSNAAHAMLVARYPKLAAKPSAVTGHGRYPVALQDRQLARQELALPQDVPVMLHFGHLRPYKGTVELLRDVASEESDFRLLVTGRVRPPTMADVLMQHSSDPRIHFRLEQVEEPLLLAQLAACDCVLLPYTDVLHSGSALLALSAGRPVVTADAPTMVELRNSVGVDWMSVASGDWVAEALRLAGLDRQSAPDLRTQDWGRIARQTRALYDSASSGIPGVSANA